MSGSASSATSQAASAGSTGNSATGQPRKIEPVIAGAAGVLLLLVSAAACLVLFYRAGAATTGATDVPIGIGVLAGIVLLLVSLAGLVLLFQALGLADDSAAFGLPTGSIRALLALGLVIVFVAVASEVLIRHDFDDQTKQVLTIAATTLSTVVGFYFGSNASTEAASKMADSLASQATGSGDTAPPPPQPPAPDQVAQKVTAIRSLATAARSAADQLGDPSFEALKAAVAAAPQPPAGPPGIDKAQDAYDRITKNLAAGTTDADRAEAALKEWRDAGSDSGKLPALATRIDQLSTDATGANHAFVTALADYKAERDALLKSIAPA